MAATTTLVLGGGFGGISAANSLRRLLPSEHRVVVIDKSSHFHRFSIDMASLKSEETNGEGGAACESTF